MDKIFDNFFQITISLVIIFLFGWMFVHRRSEFVLKLGSTTIGLVERIRKISSQGIELAEFQDLSRAGKPVAATAEGVGGIADPSSNKSPREILKQQIEVATRALEDRRSDDGEAAAFGIITHYPYLRHEAIELTPRTTPQSGRYGVKAWIEFDTRWGFPPEDVDSVTYILDDTFLPQHRRITTQSVGTGFLLRLVVWGEMTIVAELKKKDGAILYLSRFIDLPGRAGGD